MAKHLDSEIKTEIQRVLEKFGLTLLRAVRSYNAAATRVKILAALRMTISGSRAIHKCYVHRNRLVEKTLKIGNFTQNQKNNSLRTGECCIRF
jgi:hypothetical protein